MQNLITHLSTKTESHTKIITEYDPKFCQLLLDYASNNFNPEGFWGKYLIDESLKNLWIETYPEFKQTVSLIPHITANLMNESINAVLIAANSPKNNPMDKATDQRIVMQILLKMMDTLYKTDKDTGMNRRRESDINKAKRTNLEQPTDNDWENVEEHLKQSKV